MPKIFYIPEPWKKGTVATPGGSFGKPAVYAEKTGCLVAVCERENDTPVITAAPRMLRALCRLAAFNRGTSDCPWEIVMEEVHAAIAEAEGRQ